MTQHEKQERETRPARFAAICVPHGSGGHWFVFDQERRTAEAAADRVAAHALTSARNAENVRSPQTSTPPDGAHPGLKAGALYWSEGGQIACGRHAPYPGSDSWVWERWTEMGPEEASMFRMQTGRLPWCETCTARRRNGRRG